jgi:preprotein translocase subunit Sec61beta
MADNKINMPGAFGGLVRYDEEYESKFKISPAHVIAFVVLILIFVIFLKLFFPIV